MSVGASLKKRPHAFVSAKFPLKYVMVNNRILQLIFMLFKIYRESSRRKLSL